MAEKNAIEKLSKCIDELTTKVASLVESSEKVKNEILNKIDVLAAELTNVKLQIASVVEENVELKGEIKTLHIQMNEVRQQALSRNMLIRGMPEAETSPAELLELVVKCINKVEAILEPHEIQFVTRIGRKLEGKTRPILVTFSMQHVRDHVIALKKKRAIKLSEISINLTESPDSVIFFDEHLTAENAVMFSMARKLRPMGAEYVWLKRGQILVKLKHDGPTKRVRCAADVTELQKLLSRNKPSKGGKTPKRPASSPLKDAPGETDDTFEEDPPSLSKPKPKKKSQKNQRKKQKNRH